MTAAVNHVLPGVSHEILPFWLPYGGIGNGWGCESWTPIVDVNGGGAAIALLQAFRAAHVPAYSASLRSAGRMRAEHVRYRLWVGSTAYSRAESTLLHVLPRIQREFGNDTLP